MPVAHGQVAVGVRFATFKARLDADAEPLMVLDPVQALLPMFG